MKPYIFSVSEFEADIDLLHNAMRLHAGALPIANKTALDLAKMGELVQRMRADAREYDRLSRASKASLWLSNAERDTEYTKAVIKIGQALQGGMVYSMDHFSGEVLGAVPPEQGEFWARQSPGMLARLMDDFPEIATAAEQCGVLAWVSDNPTRIRLVNTAWLTSEDDITKFVTEPAPMGRRCRFCCAAEPHDSTELQPVESGQRGKLDVLVSGMKGRRQAVLNPGLVYVHAPCEGYWLKWVDIALRKHREDAA